MFQNNYVKQWTKAAIDCYNRGCVCRGCPMSKLETRCLMKGSVIELVRKFGAPKEEEKSFFTPYEQRILNAIKNGCETVAEISQELNKKESAITGQIHIMYMKARSLGWHPIKKGVVAHSLLPQFIRWVREDYEGFRC